MLHKIGPWLLQSSLCFPGFLIQHFFFPHLKVLRIGCCRSLSLQQLLRFARETAVLAFSSQRIFVVGRLTEVPRYELKGLILGGQGSFLKAFVYATRRQRATPRLVQRGCTMLHGRCSSLPPSELPEDKWDITTSPPKTAREGEVQGYTPLRIDGPSPSPVLSGQDQSQCLHTGARGPPL